MPCDPYFIYYFHLWQTILHLRLTAFDLFFEIPASILLLSAKLLATLPHCDRASMLNKKPKVHVIRFKTWCKIARASGLHFATPSWAWSWAWGWYQNMPITFFHRAGLLNKIPKVISFKTVDARASGLHFTTASWAWSWPWGWYHKIPIRFFHRVGMLNKIP